MNRGFPSSIWIAPVVIYGLAFASPAAAQATIRHPGDHPNYSFEAEPHLALNPYLDDAGVGPGFRGTVQILDNGFIPSINDSIGIGFGLDLLFYGNPCNHCGTATEVVVPVVLQWNFWLARQWSVFGEPGFDFHFHTGPAHHHFDFDPFAFYAGGRFHFNDSVALTLRLGAPFFDDQPFSIGVSFLL